MMYLFILVLLIFGLMWCCIGIEWGILYKDRLFFCLCVFGGIGGMKLKIFLYFVNFFDCWFNLIWFVDWEVVNVFLFWMGWKFLNRKFEFCFWEFVDVILVLIGIFKFGGGICFGFLICDGWFLLIVFNLMFFFECLLINFFLLFEFFFISFVVDIFFVFLWNVCYFFDWWGVGIGFFFVDLVCFLLGWLFVGVVVVFFWFVVNLFLGLGLG